MNNSRELTKNVSRVDGLDKPPEGFAPYPSVAGYEAEGNAEVEKGVHDYLYAIRKRLWMILSVTLISTLLAAIYMARKPDIYGVEARLEVDYESNPALSAAQSTAVIVSSPVSDPNYINTQLQVLAGAGLLRRVAKTLDLEHNMDFRRPQAARERSTWQSLLRMFGLGGKGKTIEQSRDNDDVLISGPVAPATAREDLAEAKRLEPYVGAIKGNLQVEQLRNTRLIGIYYSHPDPQIAAKIANAIADTFVLANLEKMTETNTSAGSFLQKRVAELQALIRQDEERLVNYAKNHQILSLDASQNTVVDRLAGLNRQLLDAENERKLAEAAYRAALVPGAAAALASGNGAQTTDETKLADLRQRRAQLLVENTEEWPEIQQIDKQVAVLEKQIADSRTRTTSVTLTNLETRYRQALAQEQSLRTAFNQQRAETVTQNESAINYRIIQQEIQTNKTLLDGLLQRYKENDLILAGTPNNIHVSDYALTPSSPSGPMRLQIVGLAFIISLALSLGFAIVLGYMDNTMRTADEVEKRLGLPALAVVPVIKSSASRRLLAASSSTLSLNGNGNGKARGHLLLNGEVRSPLAEVYRKLRTSVLVLAGQSPKTLLITSSLPSEGKTTTAVNTALILSRTGAKVLLIDADMRHPFVHEIFGLENQSGLSDSLTNEMSDGEIASMIVQHEASGLHILMAGSESSNPAELLASEKMQKLLATLGASFNHIIIDSPPIAPFTDSVLISLLVDGVLLVVEGGKSSPEIVHCSQRALENVGAKIFGVVLNKVDMPANNHYYQYYQPA